LTPTLPIAQLSIDSSQTLQVDGDRAREDASRLADAFWSAFEGVDMDEDEEGEEGAEEPDEVNEDAGNMTEPIVSAKAWVR
jgi:transcriptional regulator of met regulon